MAYDPSEVVESSESVRMSWKICNGSPYQTDGYTWVTTAYFEKMNRAKESRPKPSNVLSSLTSQAEVSTIYNTMGWTTGMVPMRNSWCCPPGRHTYYDYSKAVHGGRTPQWGVSVEAPEPDWVTPLRLKVAERYVNIGADLGEFKQTASMFADAGRAVLNGWKHLRGKHVRGRRRTKLSLCHVADAKLIYSFGIAPLVGSVFDSYMALKFRLEHPVYWKFVQSASETNELTTADVQHESREVWKRDCHAKVYVQFQPGHGIIPGTPWQIAWELVPYSFLFDYLIPIGDSLMALDALASVTDIKGTVTTRDTVTVEQTVLPGYFSAQTSIVETEPSTHTRTSHRRDFITQIPLPPFPKWEPSASYHKLANSVSLLVGANQRCRKRARVR